MLFGVCGESVYSSRLLKNAYYAFVIFCTLSQRFVHQLRIFGHQLLFLK